MKKFQKLLSLILVIAMMSSFVVLAGAKTSKDYKDADDIHHAEAVDVLSAIGIINGSNGKFSPAAPVTRAEMAKMIAVLHNHGQHDKEALVGSKVFGDTQGHWAEGYVAYCADRGIVSGRNEKTYDPNGKVAGVEVLKMLLGVLGYDAKAQGYVGAKWKENILRDAETLELLDEVNFMDPSAPATREESAQMMLNALQAGIKGKTTFLYETIPGLAVKDTKEDAFRSCYRAWKVGDGSEVNFDRTYLASLEGSASTTPELLISHAEKLLGSGYRQYPIYVNGCSWGHEWDNLDRYTGNGNYVEFYHDRVVVAQEDFAKVGEVTGDSFTLVNENGKLIGKWALQGRDFQPGDFVNFCYTSDSGGSVDPSERNLNQEITDYLGPVHLIYAYKHPIYTTRAIGGEFTGAANLHNDDNYVMLEGNIPGLFHAACPLYNMRCNDLMVPTNYHQSENWKDMAAAGLIDIYIDMYGYIIYWEPHQG